MKYLPYSDSAPATVYAATTIGQSVTTTTTKPRSYPLDHQLLTGTLERVKKRRGRRPSSYTRSNMASLKKLAPFPPPPPSSTSCSHQCQCSSSISSVCSTTRNMSTLALGRKGIDQELIRATAQWVKSQHKISKVKAGFKHFDPVKKFKLPSSTPSSPSSPSPSPSSPSPSSPSPSSSEITENDSCKALPSFQDLIRNLPNPTFSPSSTSCSAFTALPSFNSIFSSLPL